VPGSPDQILTAAQMRSAEAALIARGNSVDELMQRAGCGAAEWIWRLAAGRSVTVLCGPGNNGGDGYVIAEVLRARGGLVQVVAAAEPASAAAKVARGLYQGERLLADVAPHGDILVDCLFGTGLTRPLSTHDAALLKRLAAGHRQVVAVDLPSGIDADLGHALNRDLPACHLTIALGAWKFAHFLMPAAAGMGALRLVEIGVEAITGAAAVIAQPRFAPPAADAHKYTRGLLGVIAGAMPGAAVLAAMAALGSGAGYVKLLGKGHTLPPDLVQDSRPLLEALADKRINALLLGPGLGRDAAAREAVAWVLARPAPTVLDADALLLLTRPLLAERTAPLIVTPHGGEQSALEQAFGLSGECSKVDRALALAKAGNMIVVAKGADTVVAAPDGRVALSARASSWLSTAGTGDVLAGVIASRLACGADAFTAACEGVWLHREAARHCAPPFTAGQLAAQVRSAYAACL
jgi:hydroxyethylthiazole kinase-like uncharacterized protein yjeF